jgi:large repetitive protein
MKNKTIVITGIVVVLAIAGLFLIPNPAASTELNSFAQCLTDKGATFYGAFWCPHCQAQKKMFGASASLLNYKECSNPDRSQNQMCIDAKIEEYPTWEFADGSRLTGEVELATLAEKTGCVLPSQQ